jgi:hypothetical protein
LVARGRTIYLVAGLTGNSNASDVQRTDLSADGTLSAWTRVGMLPAERSHHAAVITQDAIYVTGGLHGDPTTGTSYNDVLRAALHDDGTLDAFTTLGTMPSAVSTHSAVAYGGMLINVGGLEDDAVFTDHVRGATIASDGSLGPWQDLTPLPTARGHVLETPMWHGFLYSPGGYTNDSLTISDVVVGTFE